MDFWILRPFSPLFWGLTGFFLLLLTAASLLLRGKSERTKTLVLVCACLLTFVGFFVYKYYLWLDADYNVITADKGGFNWWGELPLHLCNINMILIPIAAWKRWRPLMSFCFFVAPLGALMALVMPGIGFDAYSVFLPRMLGYFGTHFMIFIEGLALVTFGLYQPKLRDLPGTALALLGIALVIFGINMLLRVTGLYPNANYFFTVETEGNPILEMFHSWLPYPFLYVLPCAAILLAYAGLIMAGFTIADKLKKKKT